MTQIGLDDVRRKTERIVRVILAGQIPLVGIAAVGSNTPVLFWCVLSLVVVIAGLAPGMLVGSGSLSRVALAMAYAAQVALLVAAQADQPWQIDMHMYFFAALGVTAILIDWRAIVGFAGFVAVHHLGLNYTFISLVFGGEPDVARVVLHAVILLAEAATLVALCAMLERAETARIASDIGQKQAFSANEQARQTALSLAGEREIEKLAQRQFIASVSAMLHRMVAGDFSRGIETDGIPAEFASVVHALDTVSRNQARLLQGARSTSTEIESVAREIAFASQAASARSEEQAVALSRATQALSDLRRGIGASADLAAQVDQAMAENKLRVEEGGRMLGGVSEAMNGIQSSSDRIRGIVDLMEDIAFQTNLLALNAGVEAARAGEAGWGFAVVASEVRHLAQRASESAQEIRKLIHAARADVTIGVERVTATDRTLEVLIAQINSAATVVSDIARRISDQAAVLGSLDAEIGDLDRTAHSSAALAEEAATSSRLLERVSSALTDLLAGQDRAIGTAA